MIGYPSWLNTKADYYYVKNNFSPAQWQPSWQALLDNLYAWLPCGTLDDPSQGITDATHQVVNQGGSGSPDCWQQQVYAQDPNCRLFQLGFTVEEVQNALKGS